MLIDYLRYVAFEGRLRDFFRKEFREYVPPEHATGMHLRFEPEELAARLEMGGHWFQPYHRRREREPALLQVIAGHFGISAQLDSLARPKVTERGRPETFAYREVGRPPGLEIIIDIHPDRWSERYLERRRYEDIGVVYRRSGPAKAHLRSGTRLVDASRSRRRYGTLCGLFETHRGDAYALTCGHVVDPAGVVLAEATRRLGRFELSRSFTPLGETEHHRRCGAPSGAASPTTPLDAALVSIKPSLFRLPDRGQTSLTTFGPITTLLQEEPVRFAGGRRGTETPGRVTAVTVRKSMELYGDGTLYDVGDVLMIGHRHPQYVVQPVSRPGDSGAAVRPDDWTSEATDPWYGMILGSDEAGAYATFAEHLWAWASNQLSDPHIVFRYAV